MLTEVWQYGSNEAELKDRPWLQDGVAPQTKAKDLPNGHRAYIPINVDDVPQGFISSHSIGNYKWIFKINPPSLNSPNKNGYVTPR